MSVAARSSSDQEGSAYAEDIIPFTENRNIKEALAEAGYDGPDAARMAAGISKLMSRDALAKGSVLRVGLMVHGDKPEVVRLSVYNGTEHALTVARSDRDQLVTADPPLIPIFPALVKPSAMRPFATSTKSLNVLVRFSSLPSRNHW